REINPKGKSRAFVNDTPVPLLTLKALGTHIMDIHSQNSNLQLQNPQFRLDLIDAFAAHQNLLQTYKKDYQVFTALNKKLIDLEHTWQQQQAEQDYHQFLYNEIDGVDIQQDEQEDLEQEQSLLQHGEDIMATLYSLSSRLISDENNIGDQLQDLSAQTDKISQYQSDIESLHQRLTSAQIELKDIGEEAERLQNRIEVNPQRLEWINQRLADLFKLCHKHKVANANALLDIAKQLQEKINHITDIESDINQTKKDISLLKDKLLKQALQLFEGRRQAIQQIEKTIVPLLANLNMPNATLKIEAKKTENLHANGIDEYQFLFSANQGRRQGDISKTVSGGEASRIMLALKYMLSQKQELPTIIFDEIDSGVSGEIAGKLAKLIQDLGAHLQVIAITHLPQVAAKATQHYQVYKKQENGVTNSYIHRLNAKEREKEIAGMLSGDSLNASALQHELQFIKR
ncbi:MAG: DNA repair protein RecN, partial [Bacteroidia bacterium]